MKRFIRSGRVRLWIRALSLLLAAALLFCACERRPQEEIDAPSVTNAAAPSPRGEISLPYTPLDSLNPFRSSSLINASLIPLVYRSLYRLNGSYEPIADLAITGVYASGRVRVSLTGNAVFSDGVAVTAKDVAYSFTLAKESPLYGAALSGVESCEPTGQFEASFLLSNEDPNVLNVLTFPVVKYGTAEDADALPVGAGPFAYARAAGRPALRFNEHAAPPIPAVGSVTLVPVTESASLMSLLDGGAIDCFYTDLSEGAAKRAASGSVEVYLNNLVFLGVNHGSYLLSDADIRQAVSLALSRGALSSGAFLNHARVAFYPVNTSWTGLSGVLGVGTAADTDAAAAEKLLSRHNVGTKGETLHYSLVYKTEGAFTAAAAELIADQLAEVNLSVEPRPLEREDYLRALANGDFDFYLGEVRLPDNMDLSVFFGDGGAASAGMEAASLRACSAWNAYRAGRCDIAEFLTAFSEEMPFIPLLFRNGQLCYSSRISGAVSATQADPFESIADWEVAPNE